MSSERCRCAWTLLVAACWAASGAAHAHAPQARAAAVSHDGAAVAIAMPGFGMLLRHGLDGSFAYLCDAALDLQPSDAAPLLAYVNDGALLIGTRNGLRRVASDACPDRAEVGTLATTAIVGLDAHAESNTAYAATAGDAPGVWRSVDGGRTWTKRSTLAQAELVSALKVSPLGDTLYLSRGTAETSELLVSTNAGESFSVIEQARGLTLLAVEPGPSGQLWALALSEDHAGNRGFDVLRAPDAEGPWALGVRVNYFGGFTLDSRGAVWVGDEAGGVHRSADGGKTFLDTAPEQAVACLTAAADAVWACAPGTPSEPALLRQPEAAGVFTPVAAFADVDRLVECPGGLDVSTRCTAAWSEWRRDVRMEAKADAGMEASGPGPETGAAESGGGCSVAPTTHRATRGLPLLAVWSCAAVAWRARARRGKG